MLSFLNMECPKCGAEYTLSIEELNIMVLFKCFECGQSNLYVAGNILELDSEIIDTGTEQEKKRHIVETAQLFACEFAGNVIENVDRVIDVNMETQMETRPLKTDRRNKKKRSKRAAEEKIEESLLLPSVKLADAPKITRKEMEDFKRIDLELIDKTEFFNRYFGGEN